MADRAAEPVFVMHGARAAIAGGSFVDAMPELRVRAGRNDAGEDATMAGEAAGDPQ